MIAIVDYGIGNLGSVTKGFRHAGAETVLSGDATVLRAAEALVLPGDGAFAASMDELRRRGLVDVLLDFAREGKPLIGICIGLQLLFDESDEHGRHPGLGLLPGRVRRFDDSRLVVPHMGWNALAYRHAHPLFEGLATPAYVYFVHSYYCEPAESDDVLATTDYGGDFAAIVGRGNVLGMQFHPEKSQVVGLRMVKNIVGWIASARARAGLGAIA